MTKILIVIFTLGLISNATLAGHHKITIGKGDHQHVSHTIMVKHPWSRASISKNGVVYVTLHNHGGSNDKLVGASSSVAKSVQLHTHKYENGIMRMRHIKSITIPAKGSATLKPGGHHIMLMGLTKKLKKGNSFPLTLNFEKAGKIHMNVKVRHAGALKNQSNHDHHHSSGKSHKMKH